MTKSCEDNTVEDIKPEKEACHTVYEKECKSVYRPQKSKVSNLPFILPFLNLKAQKYSIVLQKILLGWSCTYL